MSESWPSTDVPWEYPQDNRDNRNRWQNAIRHSFNTGTLRLDGDDDSGETGMYDLIGRCPRCDHLMGQAIEFDVVRKDAPRPLPGDPPSGQFNIVCNCDQLHAGRPTQDTSGCGWALSISVKVVRP